MPGIDIVQDYLPVLIVMGITAAIAVFTIIAGILLKPKNKYPEKLAPWECGIKPVGEAIGGKFSVQFYIIAVLFVIFDVETLFLFPWAVVLDKIGILGFIEMFIFIIILLAGFVYAWAKGALDWVK